MEDQENADTFSTALQHLFKLHTEEIKKLQAIVEHQKEQLEDKERQLEIMKVSVSKAKKKLQQQCSHIKELEAKLNVPHNANTPSVYQHQTPKQSFNQTAAPLFSESPLSMTGSTPAEVRATEQSVNTSPMNPTEHIHIEEVNELDYADSANKSESTDISEEGNDVMIIEKTYLHGDETVGPEDSGREAVVDAPQTCVSLFEPSVRTSPRPTLRLKRPTNKSRIQYKETGNNTSAESSSASVESNSFTNKSPSLLSETELPSPNLSESNSPPFLGFSPHKPLPSSPRSLKACDDKDTSVSILQQSSSRPYDREAIFKTPPINACNIPIPLSDSQLSLDVSQSIPLSPELPTTALRGASSLKPKNLKRQLSDIPLVSSKQRKIKTSPGHCAIDPALITNTPYHPPTTMIPITPGMPTVQTIFNKVPSYVKHDSDNPSSESVNSDNVLPATKSEDHRRDSSVSSVEEVEASGQNGEGSECFEGDSPVFEFDTPLPRATLNRGSGTAHRDEDPRERAKRLAQRAGLPDYPCVIKILKKTDREKLDGKACPHCKKWYDGNDGIHEGNQEHLRHTCRHKHLYLPPDTDPKLWDISFPDSEECNNLMEYRH